MSFPNVTFGEENLAKTQTITLRQGDRLPTLVAQVVDDLGDVVDLSGQTAWLSSRRIESSVGGGSWEGLSPWRGRKEMIVLTGTEGIVQYDWQVFDTALAEPGVYELVVTLVSDATGLDLFTTPSKRTAFLNVRSQVHERTNKLLAQPIAQDGFALFEPPEQGGKGLVGPLIPQLNITTPLPNGKKVRLPLANGGKQLMYPRTGD